MMKRTSLLLCLATVLFCTASQADDGYMNTGKLPEAAQWQYALGTWQVTTQYTDQGKLVTADDKATVIFEYLRDGITLQSQFIIPGQFYSTQIIAYNKKRKLWVSNFVNSTRQRWTTTESRWIDGQMISLVPRGFSNDAEFMQRSIDTIVSDGHYTKSVDRSYDLGETWEIGVYLMDFKRIASEE
jgi:hypothetical protein